MIKVTLIVIKHLSHRRWPDVDDFLQNNCIPKDNHQLEIALGVAHQTFAGSNDKAHPQPIQMGQTKAGLFVPQTRPHPTNKPASKPPSKGLKCKADGDDQGKKKANVATTSRPS